MSAEIPFSRIVSFLAVGVSLVLGFQLFVPIFLFPSSIIDHLEVVMGALLLIPLAFLLASCFYYLAWKAKIDNHILVSISLTSLVFVSVLPLFVKAMQEKSPYLNGAILGILFSLLIYVGEIEYEESKETTSKTES